MILGATLLAVAPAARAQVPEDSNVQLAREYARKGEHEKAAFLFGRLRNDEQAAPNILPDYLAALQALGRTKDAEKLVKTLTDQIIASLK